MPLLCFAQSQLIPPSVVCQRKGPLGICLHGPPPGIRINIDVPSGCLHLLQFARFLCPLDSSGIAQFWEACLRCSTGACMCVSVRVCAFVHERA
mmetsp:Transcript_24519/g.58120  ORF Transcript_24519/g.58120 Transcript_24519/m.58120 type:complete len:94 (+) Transcript_24519:44-325(+)